MKFSSKSASRSLALALVIGSALGFSTVGVTFAQSGTSQGSSTGQGSSRQGATAELLAETRLVNFSPLGYRNA